MRLGEHLKNRRRIFLASVLLLTGLVIAWLVFVMVKGLTDGQPKVTSPIEATITALKNRKSAIPSTESAPGVIVYGRVLDQNGVGVEDVTIYRSYSSYPGEVIATTDESGYYLSSFFSIPGDEMVAVWAEKQGVVFEPSNCYWRHYYGYEHRTCNFTAQP